MIILITGGRKYDDWGAFHDYMAKYCQTQEEARNPVTHIIHGGATGVDTLAHSFAHRYGLQPVKCEALWDFYPHKGPMNAGHLRNAAMLELRPDVVIAFPGGSGTADMVKQTRMRLKEGAAYPHALVDAFGAWKK